MAFDLKHFQTDHSPLDVDYLTWLIDEQAPQRRAWHERLWNYYRNPLIPATAGQVGGPHARPYMLAQEVGLPARITGVQRIGGDQITDLHRKEVVVENDIGWRVQTMTDYLFGKGIRLRSRAAESTLARTIETVLHAMLDANGGQTFLENLAIGGAVHGFVDIALRIPADWPASHLSARQRSAARRQPARTGVDGSAGIFFNRFLGSFFRRWPAGLADASV